MSETEKEFINSFKALCVRYNVTLEWINGRQMAVLSKDNATPDKFVYLPLDRIHDAIKLDLGKG
jgi:hypothetical protein